MKLTPEDRRENVVDLLSAAMTNPLDRGWLRSVVESIQNVPGIDVEAAYRAAARLAEGRGVQAPSFRDLMREA